MSTRRAGPELPPHLLAKRKRQAETVGALPAAAAPEQSPSALNENPESRSSTPDSASKRRRIVGPAPPPAPLDERPSGDPDGAGESSDNEDFGPAPPTANSYRATHEQNDDIRGVSQTAASQEREKAKRRDDWMTMPPKQDDLAARMDPTKIRAKGFNTAKGARGANQANDGDNAMWTETPEEKRKRLENEVLGITPTSSAPKEDVRTRQRRKEDEEKARQIQEHNERHRNKSLYEQHQGSTRKEKEDDPSKRAFDYEKDMAAGAKIGHAQKRELLNKAAGFSSKFSSGSFL